MYQRFRFGGVMFGWFKKNSRNDVSKGERYILYDTKVQQYFDSVTNGWRWVQYQRFSDTHDSKGELMQARHSRPFPKDTSFEEATAQSQSFHGDFNELSQIGKMVKHMDLVNPTECTRSGISMRRLADGSLLTDEQRYSDNERSGLNKLV
jgi:hypothetical protein